MWIRTASMSVSVALIYLSSLSTAQDADDEDDAELELTVTDSWEYLHRAGRRARGRRPLPANSRIEPLDDLRFTGPAPGHPFVLGNYVADGTWGVVNGGIQLVDGYNAAFRLATARDFELEGTIDMREYGGWFLLIGWRDGRGYSISNVTMRESGSPWFITEYRGDAAIPEAHEEIIQHEWRREQEFTVTVKENLLTFTLGRLDVLDEQALPNYDGGDVIFGVYDTRYGPRPVSIRVLRIRSLD